MSWTDQIRDAVVSTFTGFGTRLGEYLPRVFGALVLLIIGYVISKVVQKVATVLLQKVGLDRASVRAGLAETMGGLQIRSTPSRLIGKLVFWILLLTFFISAAEVMGLESVSRAIDSLVSYLPNIVASLIIAVVGLLLAHVLRDAVRSGLERANVEYANTVAQVAYGLVVVVVLSAAVGQLHFDIALLNRVVEIGLLAGAAAVAITLGLGSRELVNNILAGTYARELHHSGIRITVGDQSGTVVQVGTVATNLTTDDGDTVYLPNTMLLTEVVRISNGSAT